MADRQRLLTLARSGDEAARSALRVVARREACPGAWVDLQAEGFINHGDGYGDGSGYDGDGSGDALLGGYGEEDGGGGGCPFVAGAGDGAGAYYGDAYGSGQGSGRGYDDGDGP